MKAGLTGWTKSNNNREVKNDQKSVDYVSDKTGIVDFAESLTRLGRNCFTGGTAKALKEAGVL